MDVTSAIVADFRARKPEFADDSVWEEPDLIRYLEEAADETASPRWGSYDDRTIKQRGMFAFAAHLAVQERAAVAAVGAGGTPAAQGQVQSKTVADETVQYAVQAPGEKSQDSTGGLRATLYGQEFLRLRRRVGMGAVTTGAVPR